MSSAAHDELVILACRWLKKTRKSTQVFAEPQSMKLCEFPDAIGYRYGYNNIGTTVVEAKVSIVDFKRDKNKQWKRLDPCNTRSGGGMGNYRFYLTPEGLVDVDDVPNDHGLLYERNGKIRVIKEAPMRVVRDVVSELSLLCTMLQRYQLGLKWFPDEFRFETKAAHNARRAEALT